MTLEDLFQQLLGPVGLLVFCLILLWAGHKKYWVWGWYAQELHDRNLQLEHRLDRATNTADKSTQLAVHATNRLAGPTEDPDA